MATYEARPGVRTVTYRRSAPVAGGLGVVDGWIVADAVPALAGAGRAPARPGRSRTAGSCRVADLAIPGAHNVSNAMAAIATGLLFGLEPELIRAAATAFTGVEHRLEPVATIDGVRFINDSQGTQPDAVDRRPARVRPADRAHRRWPGQGHRPVRARPGRRRASRRGRAHRRERAGPRDRVPGRRPRPHRARAGSRRPRSRRAEAIARGRPGRVRGAESRRCCSARPPPASTCSSTTPPGAGRSRTAVARTGRSHDGGGDR